jgi:hypothetical protein
LATAPVVVTRVIRDESRRRRFSALSHRHRIADDDINPEVILLLKAINLKFA